MSKIADQIRYMIDKKIPLPPDIVKQINENDKELLLSELKNMNRAKTEISNAADRYHKAMLQHDTNEEYFRGLRDAYCTAWNIITRHQTLDVEERK